ncbi:MAG: sensor histidine kinase [Oliverpabstia sp.]
MNANKVSIVHRFMNLSLTKKILIIYSLTVLLPTTLLMSVFFGINLKNIEKTYYKNQENIILSAQENLNIQMNQIASATNYFQESTTLKQMLSSEFPKTGDFLFHYIQDIIPLLDTVQVNSQIQGVHIYGFGDYPLNMEKGFCSISHSGLTDEQIQTIKDHITLWSLEEQEETCVLKYYEVLLSNTYPYYTGLISFDVNLSALAEDLSSQVNTPIIFQLSDGKKLQYFNRTFSPVPADFQESEQAKSKIYTLNLPESDFQIMLEILPMSKTSMHISFLFLLLGITLFIFTAFYFLITKSIIKRLQAFALHIKQSDAENLEPCPGTFYQDEVGYAITSYNDLLERTNQLIHENLMVQLQKKESDYYALQSQIRPHFLYNILENIRMSAEMHNDPETGDMLQVLGRHMRYTLNMSPRPVPLEEELKFSKNFLQIHKIRMKDKMNFEILIAAEIDEIYCLRFIFQPLLENALSHGFSLEKPLFIKILITEESDQKILIVVEDDGNGIPENKLAELREKLEKGATESSNHVGLLNVNSRLMSFCHQSTGCIHLDSIEGQGTRVFFTLDKGVTQYENLNC